MDRYDNYRTVFDIFCSTVFCDTKRLNEKKSFDR